MSWRRRTPWCRWPAPLSFTRTCGQLLGQRPKDLESELRHNARDKYTYRELKDFADRIRDRLKQSHYVAQIDMVGSQDEQVWLSYSGQRLNQFGITPLSIVDRVQERNINIPGGQVELPDQNVVVRPTGEYTSAEEIGQTVIDVSSRVIRCTCATSWRSRADMKTRPTS